MQTTLEKLREHRACYDGYNRVVRMIQGREFTDSDLCLDIFLKHENAVVYLDKIAKNCGLDDAIWALRCIEGRDRDIRLFAVWCAREAERLMTSRASFEVLSVAERFANGMASEWERMSAASAANAMGNNRADDAAYCAASRYAAEAAAYAAAHACVAVDSASFSKCRDAQKEMFIKMCHGEAPWQTEGA